MFVCSVNNTRVQIRQKTTNKQLESFNSNKHISENSQCSDNIELRVKLSDGKITYEEQIINKNMTKGFPARNRYQACIYALSNICKGEHFYLEFRNFLFTSLSSIELGKAFSYYNGRCILIHDLCCYYHIAVHTFNV